MENEVKTNEPKTNWFKTHKKQCIIGVVAVVAIVAVVVVVLMMMNSNSPEKVMETYVKAMSSGNSDELVKITDLKGAAAWGKCNHDPEKFLDEYNKISDDEAKGYEKEVKSALDAATSLFTTLGSKFTMETSNIEKPEQLANNIYKVKAKVKIKVSIFGINHEQDVDLSIAVYNGKFIGECK
ncbi:MAG: hypothetical protein J6I85_04255 [Clostridia bacterium]|nr:hypothetical protein [Clostridia bacterium]